MGEKPIIELKGIRKVFGSVVANDSIDLDLKRGEILALLGENGSGKTTLMNMMSGIYKPDEGQIFINGIQTSINSPEDAKRLGIGMVHQHFKLVEKFTVADNILLSSDADKDFFLTASRFEKLKKLCDEYSFSIDLKKHVCDMSVSEKQNVEILKVLYCGADILILDEPTAVLTLQETRKLFDILRSLRDKGCAIIIITHKLNEVMEISDRVTVLRKGRTIETVETASTDAQALTELMVGHKVVLEINRPESHTNATSLRLSELVVKGDAGETAVNGVSFEAKGGEIVGIAGVSGSGQKELCEAIAGLRHAESGSVEFNGENITAFTPRQIIKRGLSMSFIPEDRLGMGLAASLGIADNMMLKNYAQAKGPFLDKKRARAQGQQVVEKLEVSAPNLELPVRRLSGGNVQKVLLGREIAAEPSFIVTAYPVRGLDINSSYTIYNILNEEKEKGTGVLFVGEDLDVMLELCDRIVVLCQGRVTGIVDARTASKEEIGLLMTDAQNSESLSGDGYTAGAAKASAQAGGEKARKKVREPLFHIAKRDGLSLMNKIFLYALAILLSLAVGGIFVLVNGVNPIEYYGKVFTGCFENTIYLRGLIRLVIPLLITSLGIAVAFKMRFWNCGGNGQFIMGAIFATAVGHLMADAAPQWLVLIAMALAGFVGGALAGFIPTLCKVKLGTSETLLTLMLNYVFFYVLSYLKNTMFFRKLAADGSVFRPDFKTLSENAWIPEVNLFGVRVDITLFIAVALTAFLFIYFKRSKHGFEIAVVGDSKNTARYAGMNVNKIIIRTMLLSAGIIGFAGAAQAAGSATSHTLADGITADVGFTGITVAWLAKLDPAAILIVSTLLGILQQGCSVAESAFSISSAASEILQAIVLFTILSADFFINYSVKINKKNGGNA